MECSDKNLIHEYSMALWLYSGSRVEAAYDLQPVIEMKVIRWIGFTVAFDSVLSIAGDCYHGNRIA